MHPIVTPNWFKSQQYFQNFAYRKAMAVPTVFSAGLIGSDVILRID